MGKVLKEFGKWLLITAIIGSIAWVSITIYKSIRKKIGGS